MTAKDKKKKNRLKVFNKIIVFNIKITEKKVKKYVEYVKT